MDRNQARHVTRLPRTEPSQRIMAAEAAAARYRSGAPLPARRLLALCACSLLPAPARTALPRLPAGGDRALSCPWSAGARANNAAPWIAFIGDRVPGGRAGPPKRNMCTDKSARDVRHRGSGLLQVLVSQNSVLVELLAKELRRGEKVKFYSMCAFDGSKWEHYRTRDFWVAVSERSAVPELWLQVLVSVLLLGLLLALDPVELQVLQNSGTDTEQNYARKIESVRRHGNYVLCTLLGTAIINASLAVGCARSSGMTWVSTVICAFGIFFIGEILPHSVASRHGLAIASKTIWVTRLLMVLSPHLLPHQQAAGPHPQPGDLQLLHAGEAAGDAARHGPVPRPGQGGAEHHPGRAGAAHQDGGGRAEPLTDCFMLASDALLDFNTMTEIMQSGYTRIPVYENECSNIVDILFVKDLAFVDPNDCTPLKTIT
ncbi:Metal transporter CNNM4, partial [Oryzias melastigma]